MNVHAPLLDLCSEGPGLITIDEACGKAASYAGPRRRTSRSGRGAGARSRRRSQRRSQCPLSTNPPWTATHLRSGVACSRPGRVCQSRRALPPVTLPAGSRTEPLPASSRARRCRTLAMPCSCRSVAGATATISSSTAWSGRATTSDAAARTSPKASNFCFPANGSMLVTLHYSPPRGAGTFAFGGDPVLESYQPATNSGSRAAASMRRRSTIRTGR